MGGAIAQRRSGAVALDLVERRTDGDLGQGQSSIRVRGEEERGGRTCWGERGLALFIMKAWEIVGDVGLTTPTSHGNRCVKGGNCPHDVVARLQWQDSA